MGRGTYKCVGGWIQNRGLWVGNQLPQASSTSRLERSCAPSSARLPPDGWSVTVAPISQETVDMVGRDSSTIYPSSCLGDVVT